MEPTEATTRGRSARARTATLSRHLREEITRINRKSKDKSRELNGLLCYKELNMPPLCNGLQRRGEQQPRGQPRGAEVLRRFRGVEAAAAVVTI